MRKLLLSFCGVAALTACATNSAREPAVDAAFAAARRSLQPAAERADLDKALVAMDSIAERCRGDAEFHALCGELNLRLAMAADAEGRPGAALMLHDAVTSLLRSRELAANTSLAGHQVRMQAATRLLAASPGAEPATREPCLVMARESFQALAAARQLDAEQRAAWSAMEVAAGDADAAVDLHVQALAVDANDTTALAALVTTAAAVDRLPRALAVLRERDDPTSLWYRGQASFLLADRLRDDASGDAPPVLTELDAAMAAFTASMQGNPAFRDSCEVWLAMCLGKKGHVAFVANDLVHAEEWLLGALRRRPDVLSTALGRDESVKLGILRLGDRIMRDFARTETLFRAALVDAPDDLDFLNNAAVYARDLGTRLTRAGKRDEALPPYERSYATYSRAVELAPADIRLRNDCALVAIHYLQRDWERSKQLLDGAIADGETILRTSPPSDERGIRDFEEALGDCYENLALWHLHLGAAGAVAAKAAALRSLQLHPGAKRPGAARHLQAAESLLQVREDRQDLPERRGG
jgi:tetratricopeptide (TPR) repeat protein